ncbi:hypothetical protein AWC38_SpisGene15903 [Stylophora pistillata]|uniref:Uncharacterized protein n=1 Tax=Stylophora pistillata TaxID=50429 RepID=A0A2B4RPX1_STYPI|nr:hypothetical protein AWC38_SpisGene15903 [Stylophora pistillata]
MNVFGLPLSLNQSVLCNLFSIYINKLAIGFYVFPGTIMFRTKRRVSAITYGKDITTRGRDLNSSARDREKPVGNEIVASGGTTYDKEDKPQEDSDCSDTEPAVAVRRAPAMIPEQEPQGGKELVNGSAPQKLHRGFSEHEIGKANSAFENDGEHSALHHENWKGKPRISFSRQP